LERLFGLTDKSGALYNNSIVYFLNDKNSFLITYVLLSLTSFSASYITATSSIGGVKGKAEDGQTPPSLIKNFI